MIFFPSIIFFTLVVRILNIVFKMTIIKNIILFLHIKLWSVLLVFEVIFNKRMITFNSWQ